MAAKWRHFIALDTFWCFSYNIEYDTCVSDSFKGHKIRF